MFMAVISASIAVIRTGTGFLRRDRRLIILRRARKSLDRRRDAQARFNLLLIKVD